MTATLTDAQALAVIEAAGCRLTTSRDGGVVAVHGDLTVKAWGNDAVAVATMLREKIASEEAWKRGTAESAAAHHAAAKLVLDAVERAAGGAP